MQQNVGRCHRRDQDEAVFFGLGLERQVVPNETVKDLFGALIQFFDLGPICIVEMRLLRFGQPTDRIADYRSQSAEYMVPNCGPIP